jgi:hypothetical protein
VDVDVVVVVDGDGDGDGDHVGHSDKSLRDEAETTMFCCEQ